jgi:hypothetical protein
MEQFIYAMEQKNIPKYAIQIIKNSPDWQYKFKYFNENELNNMIHFYPTFYINVVRPLNMVTERELYILSNQLNKFKI